MTMRRRVLPSGWYPSTAEGCVSDIRGFLAGFTPPAGTWRGGVAPHAGWYFSGRAAAKVVCTLAAGPKPDRVVLFGGHLRGNSRPIAYTEESWETPLGPLQLDSAFARELVSAGEAEAAAGSYADNTVEVELPMVAHFFPGIPVIAVHAPASDRAMHLGSVVAGMLEASSLSAVYLGSADLTHYGPNYGFSPQGTGAKAVEWVKQDNDRVLIDKALVMDATGLLEEARVRQNTCSAGPIAAVMAAVSRAGVTGGKLLDYYTSYDVMANSSFVGYAAIVY